MTPHIPEDIDALFDAATHDAAQAMARQASAGARQQRFEEKAMRRILACYGLQHLAAPLKRERQALTGQDGLLFPFFLARYPEFPASLHFHRVPFMHRVTPSDLFRRFSTLQAFKLFEKALEQDATGKPVGLVFDWPTPEQAEKVEGMGLMVLHNQVLDHDCPHTRFSRRFMTDPPQTVHVMRLRDFLDGLRWSPG